MAKKGKNIYVPHVVIDELHDIMRENEIGIKSVACRKMVKYARIGREVERITRLDWSRARDRIPVDKKRKRKTMRLF